MSEGRFPRAGRTGPSSPGLGRELAADDGLEEADSILLVPDLVAYLLAGKQVCERANASTTGLLDVRTREWDTELMVRVGLDVGLFPDLVVDPGHEIGPLTPGISDKLTGRDGRRIIIVIAVGSHDTVSRIGVVHVVGGGSQNTFLCQAIADRAGLPVLAGPDRGDGPRQRPGAGANGRSHRAGPG